MGITSTPDFSGYLDGVWAWPVEFDGFFGTLSAASNVVVGTNPPYSLGQFFTIFPLFGGVALTPTATTVEDSAVITVSSGNGIAVGNPIVGAGIPVGATVVSISGTSVTLSEATTASASNVALQIWNAPALPFAVLNAYLCLASAHLVQQRWLDTWCYGMALFIAHFATLWLRQQTSLVNPPTAAQIAAQGLALGIQTAKAVHDVSVSYQIIGGWEDWGAFGLTTYGMELIFWANSFGAGPMLIW